ncbi:MAG: tetratricopeptide repeat protein [Gemmatimonadaceae bacterium]
MQATALPRTASVRVALASRVARFIPLAAFVAASGCFATRNDVRTVQTDIASMRTELLKNDAEQRDGLARAMRTIQMANDSITAMSARMFSIQGNINGGLRNVNDQLISVQELLKQSASTISRLRADAEQRANQAAVTMQLPPTTATSTDTTTIRAPADAVTGPNELYAAGMSNLARGSTSTARNTFQQLLDQYPTSDKAPSAQLGIAASYAKENNVQAAFVAYSAVITKYPDARETANALYKKAFILMDQGKRPEAKLLLQQITSRAPFRTTDEYALAVELLKSWTP